MEKARSRWVLLATIVGSSLVFIDGSVVSLALPSLQREMHATSMDAQWVVEAYALVLGALMLFGGALGDRIGRRRVFIGGVVIFAIGSLACAIAPNMALLVAARILQGLGGMLLAPASLALLSAQFGGEERDRAFAQWSAYSALTTTIGPALGGVIIDHFGWRMVFLVNVPLAALVVWAALRHVSESRDEAVAGPLDTMGAILATTGLGAITYALIASTQHHADDLRVTGASIAGVAAVIAFVINEARVRAPIMPLSLFANRTFSGVNVLTLLLYGALSGFFYFLPFDMIQVHGYSATQAAVATLPFVAGLALLSRASTRIARITSPRIVLCIGPVIVGCGFALFGLLESNVSYWTTFLPGVLGIALGMGLTVATLTATVMDSADPNALGSASGVNNAVSRVAGLIAIAALGAVLWSSFNVQLDAQLQTQHFSAGQVAQIDAQRPAMAGTTLRDPQLRAPIVGAFRRGVRIIAFVSALLCIAGGLIALVTISRRGLVAARAVSDAT